MKPIYKLNSMNKKFKRLNNISIICNKNNCNRVRNERSMNLQLKTKTQLYNIPGIKDDLQEQEIHPKTNQ